MMKNKCKFKYTGAMVLGMHDALVEMTGITAGLAFTIDSGRVIVMTGVIAAVAASLSMAAANYMAQRTDENPDAMRCAVFTGMMYILTSAAVIAPFCFIQNRSAAVGTMAAVAVMVIFVFNLATMRTSSRPFYARFAEMLMVCAGVSVASFAIGMAAKHFLGVTI